MSRHRQAKVRDSSVSLAELTVEWVTTERGDEIEKIGIMITGGTPVPPNERSRNVRSGEQDGSMELSPWIRLTTFPFFVALSLTEELVYHNNLTKLLFSQYVLNSLVCRTLWSGSHVR